MNLKVEVTVEKALKLYREKDICIISGSKQVRNIQKKYSEAKKNNDVFLADYLVREIEMAMIDYYDTILPYFCEVKGIEKDIAFYNSFGDEFEKQLKTTFRPEHQEEGSDKGKQKK